MAKALLLVVLLVAPLAARAGPLEDGEAAYERGDYATAWNLLWPLGVRGDADAQRTLAAMSFYGQGVPQNYVVAEKWDRLAADQGNHAAEFDVGSMYENGQGVPQDYAEAARWYVKAAEAGYASAQINLGLLYENGRGVSQDHSEAVKWFRKAADRGEPIGQIELALMYEVGRGVPQDSVQAHKWFNLAAARLPESDTKWRGLAVRGRDRVAEFMTPAQIAEAQRLAQEWKPNSP